jgi:hypothetical protein
MQHQAPGIQVAVLCVQWSIIVRTTMMVVQNAISIGAKFDQPSPIARSSTWLVIIT